MDVFARWELAARCAAEGAPCLLLEGAWPVAAAERWSLDEAIDDRCRWIDRAAAELAEALGGASEISFAFLNALALRYYFVKLLRVVAFFDQAPRPNLAEKIRLHVARGRDEDYVDLFQGLARTHGFTCQVERHDAPKQTAAPAAAAQGWRRWAARVDDTFPAPAAGESDQRIVLCGNPRLLDPVCEALVARGCRVWWMYERFAVRSWFRWRRAGVGQLVCDGGAERLYRYSDSGPACDLTVRGVDLAPAVERWLGRQAAKHGSAQSRLVARIDEHFRAVRPTGLILDEDATPLKRAAVALARRRQARSLVVQHGAPCGPFGFAPQAADGLCTWGAASREQLLHFGASPERVFVTGWPQFERRATPRPRRSLPPRNRRTKRILLLATMPPDDGRPDTVSFHLTRQTHEQMLDMACTAVARLPRARLTIKLHPRSGDDAVFRQALERHPALRGRIVRSPRLDRLIAESDCVLSCASTSGIEAALAGAPVVQLLPAGSGDILPADRWGLLGSARTLDELNVLLEAAMIRGWRTPAEIGRTHQCVCSRDPDRSAAERIVDVLLEGGEATGGTPRRHGERGDEWECGTESQFQDLS